MSYPGAIPPPEGFVPDLANPQDVLRTCNIVTQVLTMVIVTVCISFRVYAKHTLPIGSFFWEDGKFFARPFRPAPVTIFLLSQSAENKTDMFFK